MTSHEILQADLLDIIFDKRNKEYGAYMLRKEYHRRLFIALLLAMAAGLLISFIAVRGKNKLPAKKNLIGPYDSVTVIELPKEKIKKNEIIIKLTSADKLPRGAQVKSSSQIKIVPDNKIIKTDVPDQQKLAHKIISDAIQEGPLMPNAKPIVEPAAGNGIAGSMEQPEKPFEKQEFAPEFPGGLRALLRFFSKNLSTPDELNTGEKKTVLAKFMVDVDGSISQIEIIKSGGDKYDNEVIRVFKKMPKWIPALQNGHKVAIYFTQPVTFIGIDY